MINLVNTVPQPDDGFNPVIYFNYRESYMPDNEFKKNYSEDNFWGKLSQYAKNAGFEVIEKTLLLYYASQQPGTPAWAKATIYGALGYFITPLDAIADITPAVGYADDLGVLALAIGTVAIYINQEVKEKAAKKLQDWFG